MGMHITVLAVLHLDSFSSQNLMGLRHLLWILAPSFCCPCGNGRLHVSSCTILVLNICVNCCRSQLVSVHCVNDSSWKWQRWKALQPSLEPCSRGGMGRGKPKSLSCQSLICWWICAHTSSARRPLEAQGRQSVIQIAEVSAPALSKEHCFGFSLSPNQNSMCWLAEQFTGICSSLEVGRYLLGQCHVEAFHAFPVLDLLYVLPVQFLLSSSLEGEKKKRKLYDLLCWDARIPYKLAMVCDHKAAFSSALLCWKTISKQVQSLVLLPCQFSVPVYVLVHYSGAQCSYSQRPHDFVCDSGV